MGFRPHVLLAILGLFALLASACGSSDSDGESTIAPASATATPADAAEPENEDPGADDSSAPSEEDTPSEEPTEEPDVPEERTASERGITADTVTIGIAVHDVKIFAPVGDIMSTYLILADLQNEAGGVGGRQIELVTQEWGILDAAAFDAACVALTEDAETFVVLGFIVSGFGDLSCYSDLHETITITSEALNPADVERSEDRLMTIAADATGLLIEGLGLISDELEGKRVAVYAAETSGRLDEATAAVEAAGGIVVIKSEQQISASEDLAAAEAELDITVERWRTEGVEAVVNLDGSIAGSLNALQRAGNTDLLMVYAGSTEPPITALGADPTQFSNLVGIGVPIQDIHYQENTFGVADCVDKVAAVKGLTITPFPPDGDDDEIGVTQRACAVWDTFITVMEAAGPNPTTESFLQTGYDLGPFPATGLASATMAPGRANLGDVVPAVYDYDTDVGLFIVRE